MGAMHFLEEGDVNILKKGGQLGDFAGAGGGIVVEKGTGVPG